ncbi:MAG TPA: hypothetical protein VII12_11600 [Thermoanaerobaculia bacterium]
MQREATLSVQIIRQIAPQETAAIIDVGGGASALGVQDKSSQTRW